jgi:hypothetical protein
MLKIKKGLANILENNNEPEEAPQPPQPQTPQSARTALKLNEPEAAPQAPQLLRSAEPAVPQPPAPAPRQVGDQMGWEDHLIQALAKAPEDVALKLATCMDREVLLKVLQRRDDPFLKVALLLLVKK